MRRLLPLALASLSVACQSETGASATGSTQTSLPPADPVTSSFDTGVDGWTLQGFDSDAGDYSVQPDRNDPSVYDATGGSPGGALERHETFYGYADYFQAPAKFLGDVSRYQGGSLRFAVRVSDGSNPFSAPLVLLQSSSTMWRYDDPGASAQTTWSTSTVPLSASGWTRADTGAPATEADLAAGLAAVTGLWIRGEFSSNIDDSWLDDVVLGR
jgi:hypothetical protein